MNIPIIKLEIEGMRHTVHRMLMEHHVELDQMVQSALDKAIQPEVLQHQIDQHVNAAVQAAVKHSIEAFFHYGQGAKFIREAAHDMLKTTLADMGFKDDQ